MSNSTGTHIKAAAAGALVGAMPGLALLLLTLPASGEAELTLGVGGLALGVIGALAGAGTCIGRTGRRG